MRGLLRIHYSFWVRIVVDEYLVVIVTCPLFSAVVGATMSHDIGIFHMFTVVTTSYLSAQALVFGSVIYLWCIFNARPVIRD